MRKMLDRLREEFLETPGLRLRVEDAQRLCGMDPTVCKALLDALVDVKFLRLKPDGSYVRASESQVPAPPTESSGSR